MRHNKFAYVIDNSLVEDYQISNSLSIIFVSLAFHKSYPIYIKQRLSEVYAARRDANKFLILNVDTEEATQLIVNITMDAMRYDVTLVCAFSFEEAANYI